MDLPVRSGSGSPPPSARICAWLTLIVGVTVGASAWQETRHPLASALMGSWSGTLEYQDYSSDRRVTLPTKLVVTPEGTNVLMFEYTYDEGKGRFITSSNRITIGSAPPTYRVQSADGRYDTTFEVEGLATFRDKVGTLVLNGRGRENDRDVDVRTTVTITRSTLTMRRDSRQPGDEWRFRNQYSLTR